MGHGYDGVAVAAVSAMVGEGEREVQWGERGVGEVGATSKSSSTRPAARQKAGGGMASSGASALDVYYTTFFL